MIVFPNAKINIGLNIVGKRTDGFHDIETIFYPIGLSDILEINNSGNDFEFSNTGIIVENGEKKQNLCYKAYNLLKENISANPVHIHLHKIIPFGSGLGGGSSDASFTIKAINTLQNKNLKTLQLLNYTSKIGSDCPFFIINKPVFATGTGNVFEEITLNLESYFLVVIYPGIHVNTAKAYSNCVPKKPIHCLKDIIQQPVKTWKNLVKNDFEDFMFKEFPEIERIKLKLYSLGAEYASMSGSGSSVFGLFKKEADVKNHFPNYFVWNEKL